MTYDELAAHIRRIRDVPAAGERVRVNAVIDGVRSVYPATIETVLRSGRLRLVVDRIGRAPIRLVTDPSYVKRPPADAPEVLGDLWRSDEDLQAELDRLLNGELEDAPHTTHEGTTA